MSPEPLLDDKAIRILLAEDNGSDALLTRIALSSTSIPFTLSTVKKGTEVLSRLKFDLNFCTSQLPDLILLDLGLPEIDGFELLSEFSRMSPTIRSLPIVVLTAHKHFDYIKHSYPLCIAAYINKPCKSEELEDILVRVRSWKERFHQITQGPQT